MPLLPAELLASVTPTATVRRHAEDVGQWRAFVEEALRTVPVTASDHVLDLATRPGTLAFAAAQRGARVSAVDFSPGMIEQARARAAFDGVSTVQAAVMDAQSLDFPDAELDTAFCLSRSSSSRTARPSARRICAALGCDPSSVGVCARC